MDIGLWQEQTQKLVMTPELRLAITVLQFSSQELLEYLEAEVSENPVMEWEGIDWVQVARQQRDEERPKRTSEVREVPFDQVVRASVSLEEHLLRQLRLQSLSSEQMKKSRYIVGHLDANGYLSTNLDEIAHAFGDTIESMEEALTALQSCDPTGVGARSLEECLQLQLRELGYEQGPIIDVVNGHLSDIAQGRYSRIASALHLTHTEVQAAVDFIRSLDPKPGRQYSVERSSYILPDVTVEKVEGEYVVVVYDRFLPSLRISPFYKKLLDNHVSTDGTLAKEARDYVNGKMHDALWLLKSIEQRRQTLYKVTEAIVELQRKFFDQGVQSLKPLTLKQVAERIGMHESTVSRATSGKYVQTPRGVFELKYFFTSGVSTDEGDGASAKSLKSRIGQLIAAEDTHQPLSDQKLTEILQEQGVQISRRTVAKYREEMKLPSSMQRKRY